MLLHTAVPDGLTFSPLLAIITPAAAAAASYGKHSTMGEPLTKAPLPSSTSVALRLSEEECRSWVKCHCWVRGISSAFLFSVAVPILV